MPEAAVDLTSEEGGPEEQLLAIEAELQEVQKFARNFLGALFWGSY